METIFVVENGEKHEGGRVISVHRTRDGAVEAALKVDCCFDGGWKQVGDSRWENGCDYVKVEEVELLP